MDLVSSLIFPSQEELEETFAILSQSSQSKRRKTDMAAAATVLPAASSETLLPHRPSSGNAEPNPFVPPPSNQENVPPFAGIQDNGFAALGLQDMADFDKEHPYEPNKLVLLQGRRDNCDSVVRFQHICDKRGLQPLYSFQEPSPTFFTATVSFGTQTIHTPEPYPGKRQARQACAKLALAQLVSNESIVGIKRKSLDNSVPEVDKSENWVGILIEHAQKRKPPYPEYQEYATEIFPIRFGCTVQISGGPLSPFGETLGPFSSKQNAKAAAAKQAVCWLRKQGILQSASKPFKLEPATPESMSNGHTGITQAMGNAGLTTGDDDTHTPVSKRLHDLVAALGFHQPRFDCRRSSTTTGKAQSVAIPFYDAAVHFDNRDIEIERRLQGPIGQIYNANGQKKAKASCYERVIQLLEQIQRERPARLNVVN